MFDLVDGACVGFVCGVRCHNKQIDMLKITCIFLRGFFMEVKVAAIVILKAQVLFLSSIVIFY